MDRHPDFMYLYALRKCNKKGGKVDPLLKFLYVLAALAILLALWQAIPPGGLEGEAWGTGIRIRLVGFAALVFFMGYFVITRLRKK